MAQPHHHGLSLLTAERIVSGGIFLEEANRIYQALTRESTLKDETSSPSSGRSYPFFVPSTVKITLGSPVDCAGNWCLFTTLTTLSFSLMRWRGLNVTTLFISNFFFGECIWHISHSTRSSKSVLTNIQGLFSGGFGGILTPLFGVKESYGDDTIGYNNALGFWVLMWAVLDLFFVFAPIKHDRNLVCVGVFFFVELGFALIASSCFAAADGKPDESNALPLGFGRRVGVSGWDSWLLHGRTLDVPDVFVL
ncbi:Acetate transporter protein [Lachnellula willkommii]|uniref:Acetate transporter protein n=1 Tax=Lachnellula willkommii TaxID=215461 RepID=A0A559M2Y6_9HELO|nr:Acetate transporter protein [Lachnellula willkommii]